MSDKALGFDPEALEAFKARFADLRKPAPAKPRTPRRKSVLETRRKREDRAINHGDMRRVSRRPNSFVQLNIKTSEEAKERFAAQIVRRREQLRSRYYNWELLNEMLDLMDEKLESEEKPIT